MTTSDVTLPVEPLADLRLPHGVEKPPKGFGRLLRSIRRHLHRHPEVGLQEYATARFIRRTLEQHGLKPIAPIAETGLYVDIKGDHPGPHIAYRADIDALPIQDAKNASYASTRRGVAHLCGHDAHTAVGIGVALLLSGMRDRLHGSVRVLFQPNEESSPSGAVLMMKEGVMEGVEAAYAIHVDPTLEVGRYGLITGPITSAADRFDVRVSTDGTGHSARPHETVDTVWAITQIANAFYQLAGRVTDTRNAAVITICKMAGSDAHNVIPAAATMGGTLRCIHTGDRDRLRAHMQRIVEQIGRRTGGNAQIVFDPGPPSVVNDGRLIQNVRRTVQELIGDQGIYDITRPSMGGEDFSHFLKHIPGALIRVGTASSRDTRYPLHSAHFDIDEDALAPAAQVLSAAMRNHLQRNVLK